jgi:hypothetical protein
MLDTVMNSRLEATRVLPTSGLRFKATGISTSAYIRATVKEKTKVKITLWAFAIKIKRKSV